MRQLVVAVLALASCETSDDAPTDVTDASDDEPSGATLPERETVSGQLWDEKAGCWTAPVDLAEDWSFPECGSTTSLFTGPGDGCWRIDSTCTPKEDVWAPGCRKGTATLDAEDCVGF